jgi:hypothetical protein
MENIAIDERLHWHLEPAVGNVAARQDGYFSAGIAIGYPGSLALSPRRDHRQTAHRYSFSPSTLLYWDLLADRTVSQQGARL